MPRSRTGTPAHQRRQLASSESSPPNTRSAARQLNYDDLADAAAAGPSGVGGASGDLTDLQIDRIAARVAALLASSPATPARTQRPDSTPGPTAPPAPPMENLLPPPLPQQIAAPPVFNQQWRDYLTQQRLINENFQTRDRQEIRVLLLATAQPAIDPQDQQFLQDRLKLFVIVGHRGWAAALTALPDLELQQLGVQLPPPAPVLHLPAPPPQVQYVAAAPAGPAAGRRKRKKRAPAPAASAAD